MASEIAMAQVKREKDSKRDSRIMSGPPETFTAPLKKGDDEDKGDEAHRDFKLTGESDMILKDL